MVANFAPCLSLESVLKITQLEGAVLEAICTAHGESLPALAAFLSNPSVVTRENTGHGFYTHFETMHIDAALAWPQPMDGPIARMVNMGKDALMGFLLWSSADHATLEGFQYGSATGATVDLTTRDLEDLRFTELYWS